MNQKAVVESRAYHLLKTIPSLTGQEQFILCEDSNGNQFVCSEELWRSHVPQPEPSAPCSCGKYLAGKDRLLSLLVPGAERSVCKALL